MSSCPPPEGEQHEAVKRAVAQMLAEDRRARRFRRIGVLACALACVVVLAISIAAREQRRPELEELRPTVAEGGFEEGVDASSWVTIGVPLPAKPLPNWKRPPCSRKQREINNACWKKLAAPPGDDLCGEDYEYEGNCWAPVAKPQRAPLTIQPAE